jgi:hypothetical protein
MEFEDSHFGSKSPPTDANLSHVNLKINSVTIEAFERAKTLHAGHCGGQRKSHTFMKSDTEWALHWMLMG